MQGRIVDAGRVAADGITGVAEGEAQPVHAVVVESMTGIARHVATGRHALLEICLLYTSRCV